jgi:hypothetical protein
MHSHQINEIFESKLRERIYFPWMKMNFFTTTAPRGTQLEGKRDMARISANACVITS